MKKLFGDRPIKNDKKNLCFLYSRDQLLYIKQLEKKNIFYEVKLVLFEDKTLEILYLHNFISLFYHCEKGAIYIFICLRKIYYLPFFSKKCKISKLLVGCEMMMLNGDDDDDE